MSEGGSNFYYSLSWTDTWSAQQEVAFWKASSQLTQREERFWRCFHLAVQQNFPLLARDADVHGAGMEITATVQSMLLGVEAPEVFFCFASGCLLMPAYHRGMRRRGLNKYQTLAADRGDSGGLRRSGPVIGQWWFSPRR
jgi:hypothetical protein